VINKLFYVEVMASMNEESVKEDTVDYRIFPLVGAELTADQEVFRFVGEKRDHMLAYLSHFCVTYIWQNEPFSLRVVCGSGWLNSCY
jgi:hypothetical protein